MILIGIGLMVLSTVSMLQHIKIARKYNVPVDEEGYRLAFINAAAGRVIILLEGINHLFPAESTLLITGLIGLAVNSGLIINAIYSIRKIRRRDQKRLDELNKDIERQLARHTAWLEAAEREERK